MTGFARVEGAHGAWSWAVEARSVNGRNLETRFRGPPGFEGLDKAARDATRKRRLSASTSCCASCNARWVSASTRVLTMSRICA